MSLPEDNFPTVIQWAGVQQTMASLPRRGAREERAEETRARRKAQNGASLGRSCAYYLRVHALRLGWVVLKNHCTTSRSLKLRHFTFENKEDRDLHALEEPAKSHRAGMCWCSWTQMSLWGLIAFHCIFWLASLSKLGPGNDSPWLSLFAVDSKYKMFGFHLWMRINYPF